MDNKITFLIPARGGSKRLKGKNMYPLNNKPLIQYTLDAIKESKYYNGNNLYVSSDWGELLEFAWKNGAECVIRPKELAGDDVWTQPVIDNFVETLKLENEDIIVILQANSPQITTEIIDYCIMKLIHDGLWQVHTVDKNLNNNGAIQVMRKKVCNHVGKPNYNGVVVTDWVDVHTIEDIKKLEVKF